MTKGMQNHVFVLKSLKIWMAKSTAKTMTLMTAAALEGEYGYKSASIFAILTINEDQVFEKVGDGKRP